MVFFLRINLPLQYETTYCINVIYGLQMLFDIFLCVFFQIILFSDNGFSNFTNTNIY